MVSTHTGSTDAPHEGAEDQLPWWARRSTGAALLAFVTLFFVLTGLEVLEVSTSSPAVAAYSSAPAATAVSSDDAASIPARGTGAGSTETPATPEVTTPDPDQVAASAARTDRRREERRLAEVRRQVADARAMYERLQRAAVASVPQVDQLTAPTPLAVTVGSAGAAVAAPWVSPVAAYRITARFGETGRYWATTHTGLDFAAPTGTPVMSVAGGTVSFAGVDGSYGQRVAVTHPDGTETWYAHLSRTDVTVGTPVAPGAVIGAVGSTGNSSGPHLHLEVRPLGGEPVDPAIALSEHGVTV